MKTIDEMIAVMTAYKEGKIVEQAPMYGECQDQWEIKRDPYWNWTFYDFRIKEESRYRPYQTIAELDNAVNKHGGTVQTNDGSEYYAVSSITRTIDGIIVVTVWTPTSERSLKMRELFECCTWLDGSLCGIREE